MALVIVRIRMYDSYGIAIYSHISDISFNALTIGYLFQYIDIMLPPWCEKLCWNTDKCILTLEYITTQ